MRTIKILFRIAKRSILGLSENEQYQRSTLERKAAYIADLKKKHKAKPISADNNTPVWKL